MTVSKRDVNVLLIFFGVIILIAAYFLGYSHFSEETRRITAETAAMEPALAELQRYQSQLDFYGTEIEASKETIAQVRAFYPEMVLPETFIQFAVGIEARQGADIVSLAVNDPAPLDSFRLPDEEGYPVPFSAYLQSCAMTANLGYGALKSTLREVLSQSERLSVDECTVTYNQESGLLSATLTISQMVINNGFYEYVPVDVPLGKVGTTNPFHTIN